MTTGSLRTSAVSGGRWGTFESIALQALSVATTAVLTRILEPTAFGIVAFVFVVTNLMARFSDVGFGASVVAAQDTEENALSTVFWAGMALSGLAAIAMAGLAPVLASIGNQEEAAGLLAVGALGFIASGPNGVPRAILLRDLRFRTNSLISVGSHAAYSLIAVGLAWFFQLGATAVIVAHVSKLALATVATLAASRWFPAFRFEKEILKSRLKFNLGYAGSKGFEYAVKNLDYWLVSAVSGAATLGVYYVAYVAPDIVRQRMSSILHRVMFPILSSISDDRTRQSNALVGAIRFLTLAAAPALVGLAVVAPIAVPVAFGGQWDDAIGPMSIIAVASLFDLVIALASPAFEARGEPQRNLSAAAIRLLILGVAMIPFVLTGDLQLAAFAVLTASVGHALFRVKQLSRPFGLPPTKFIIAVGPALTSSIAMGCGVFAFVQAASLPPILHLIGAVALGIATYGLFGLLFFRPVFVEFLSQLRSIIKRS